MSTPSALAQGSAERAPPRSLRFAWLFSPFADVAMLAVPALSTALAFAFAVLQGQDENGSARPFAGWLAAFVLGNTSHVILTFLLLGVRRDMLRATETQARSVITASVAVFAVSLGMMLLVRDSYAGRPFFEAVIAVFALHHTISQAKGFWALYGLRGAEQGLPPPSARERSLQQLFVPLALLLLAVKWNLVPRVAIDHAQPFVNVLPPEGAILPFSVTYPLLAAWLVFAALVLRAVTAYDTLNVPKVTYIGAQCTVIAVELCWPGWGVTIATGIHGLEYYLLTRRMLEPTPGEPSSRLRGGLCWLAMLAAMSPIVLVGVVRNPVGVAILDGLNRQYGSLALMVVNATVLAHYAADAFIYRFRIPGIRKVAMARLGFGALR